MSRTPDWDGWLGNEEKQKLYEEARDVIQGEGVRRAMRNKLLQVVDGEMQKLPESERQNSALLLINRSSGGVDYYGELVFRLDIAPPSWRVTNEAQVVPGALRLEQAIKDNWVNFGNQSFIVDEMKRVAVKEYMFLWIKFSAFDIEAYPLSKGNGYDDIAVINSFFDYVLRKNIGDYQFELTEKSLVLPRGMKSNVYVLDFILPFIPREWFKDTATGSYFDPPKAIRALLSTTSHIVWAMGDDIWGAELNLKVSLGGGFISIRARCESVFNVPSLT